MNIAVALLICGSNIVFLFCGYKLAEKKQIITISKGDKLEYIDYSKDYKDFQDEEASFVTPEMEQAYEAYIKKKGDASGMET